MINIIYDERRFLNVGEVCAIQLKNIKPVDLVIMDNELYFFGRDNGISSDEDITFIKYLGHGMFMDLISDQLFMSAIHSSDDFGTDEFDALNNESKSELDKMINQWFTTQNAKNIEDFKQNFSIFMQHPLAIDVGASPFISITSDVAKKLASQSLEHVKSKILLSKLTAQQNLQKKYSELEEKINELYASKINSSSKKI